MNEHEYQHHLPTQPSMPTAEDLAGLTPDESAKLWAEFGRQNQEYNDWTARNTPDVFQSHVAAIRKHLPSKSSDMFANPTAFIAMLLNLVQLIIATLNELVPGGDYSLTWKAEDGRRRRRKSNDIHTFSDMNKSAYDSKKDGYRYRTGIALSAFVFKNGKGRLALMDRAGMKSHWVSQDMLDALYEASPGIKELADALKPGRNNKAHIPDKDIVYFTWERVQKKVHGELRVVAFTTEKVHDAFHEHRQTAYHQYLTEHNDVGLAGDHAESLTEQIMERLGVL